MHEFTQTLPYCERIQVIYLLDGYSMIACKRGICGGESKGHSTVRVKLVVGCSEPSVAITLTVDMEAIGEMESTPQPMQIPNPSPAATPADSRRRPRRFLQPKQQNAAASDVPGKIGLELGGRAAVAVEVATVRVVEAASPAGVTLAGEKLHADPVGKPEQLNVTVEAYPFSGVTRTEALPLCPLATVTDEGKRTTEKLGDGALIV